MLTKWLVVSSIQHSSFTINLICLPILVLYLKDVDLHGDACKESRKNNPYRKPKTTKLQILQARFYRVFSWTVSGKCKYYTSTLVSEGSCDESLVRLLWVEAKLGTTGITSNSKVWQNHVNKIFTKNH